MWNVREEERRSCELCRVSGVRADGVTVRRSTCLEAVNQPKRPAVHADALRTILVVVAGLGREHRCQQKSVKTE